VTLHHNSIPRKELSKLKLKLKVIKAYVRSLIQQYSLQSLAIMSIESEINRGLNLDKILRIFEGKK